MLVSIARYCCAEGYVCTSAAIVKQAVVLYQSLCVSFLFLCVRLFCAAMIPYNIKGNDSALY